MKKTKLGNWIFVAPVIAIILFSFYYFSDNKKNQDNVVNINSDEKIPAVLLEEAIKQARSTASCFHLKRLLTLFPRRAAIYLKLPLCPFFLF